MARAHIFRPLTDATGTLLTGATVTILDPATGSLISDILYVDDASTVTLTNPFTVDNGYIDFYLDNPRRIELLATLDQTSLGVFLDIYPPADQVVVGVDKIRIVNTPTPGSVLVASATPGEAMWITTGGLAPATPPEAPIFLTNSDPAWDVEFVASGMFGQIYDITLTVPPGAPWDGSGDAGTADLTISTYSALFFDGTGPQLLKTEIVDMSAVTNTYTYTVSVPTGGPPIGSTNLVRQLYWVLGVDSTGTVVFDWRRG
jgi:hypothetical protein